MAKANELASVLQEMKPSANFSPYVEFSEEADALNVYFRPDPDYSKRLTDHVTLFLSLENHRIVGCRIKGVAQILEDLPNYIDIDHGGVKLSVIFWSFRGGAVDETVRSALSELAKEAGDLVLSP